MQGRKTCKKSYFLKIPESVTLMSIAVQGKKGDRPMIRITLQTRALKEE